MQIRKSSDAAVSTRALNVTYNTFKSPVQIEETGIDKISFTYNDGNDRSSMFYGGQQSDKLLRTYRKHYSADGTMEVKHNTVTGTVEFVTYIGGDGYSAPVVLKSDGTTQNYLYLHRDYQGTITAVSDQSGAVVEKRLFDAWGSIIKVQDGAGNVLAGLTVLDRGYTGHEHLQSVGIIHMNGRLYDPNLHRFLQPDNYIQQPDNTQNYNKYAYVLNNPLKYTDPSGEEIVFGVAVGIGAAIAALTYTITALVADVPFSVGGLVKATFIGAASAAVTFGIGTATSSIFSTPAMGFWQGAYQGAVLGSISGAGGSVFNAIVTGNNITLKSVLGGAVIGTFIGGAIGGIQGGLNAQDGDASFWNGNIVLDTSKGVGLHGDSVAMEKAGFGKISIKAKYVGKYEGVNVYETKNISLGSGENSGGLTLPPNKILVGKGAYSLLAKSNAKILDLFHHEFGHILESRQWFVGMEGFYKIIAPESLASSSLGTTNFANNYWTETWANQLSENYFGTPFTNTIKYPSASLSNYNLSKFLILKAYNILNF